MPRFLCAVLALIAGASPSGSSARVYTGGEDLEQAWDRYGTALAGYQPVLRFPYEHCFQRAAAAHDMPIALLLAVARGESDFDPNARSHANAHGLMQILWPDTAHHLGLGRLSELYEPCKNVDAGTRYLKELMRRYDGDLHLAVAAYNYGPRRIPVAARSIPQGAEWYSGYIYGHLQYVIGRRNSASRADGLRDYAEEGQLDLILFGEPYRAAAFVNALEEAAPALRLDWFKVDVGRFRVVLLYDGYDDLERSRALLATAGFALQRGGSR